MIVKSQQNIIELVTRPAPHLQLIQRSITIYCQQVRALQYHTSLMVYSLEEAVFTPTDSLKCQIVSALCALHRKWEHRAGKHIFWHQLKPPVLGIRKGRKAWLFQSSEQS